MEGERASVWESTLSCVCVCWKVKRGCLIIIYFVLLAEHLLLRGVQSIYHLPITRSLIYFYPPQR